VGIIAIVIVASVVGHKSFPVHVHGCPWTADRRRKAGEDLQLRTGQTVWHRMENRGSRGLNIYHFSWAIYVTESSDLQIGKSISNILLGVWD